jgi:hypothetical protein
MRIFKALFKGAAFRLLFIIPNSSFGRLQVNQFRPMLSSSCDSEVEFDLHIIMRIIMM